MFMEQKSTYYIPLAIIVAGAFIGVGLAFGLSNMTISGTASAGLDNGQPEAPKDIVMRAVTAQDHVRGDMNAPLTIVEYSDLECPFCKRFHTTMQQVMQEYAGKVKWVYRHFPLEQLHSKAPKEAEAAECAAEQGKFWEFVDRLMEVTPANNGLDPAELPKIAEFVKINVATFTTCLESGKYKQKVDDDVKDAVSAGGQGTPYSVLIDKDGNKEPISGAYPFEDVKAILDAKL